jgi:hypothetical protein
MTSNWIECQYDDDGEIVNPEFVSAPDDTWMWIDRKGYCHAVMCKCEMWFRPVRFAIVVHPDEA